MNVIYSVKERGGGDVLYKRVSESESESEKEGKRMNEQERVKSLHLSF